MHYDGLFQTNKDLRRSDLMKPHDRPAGIPCHIQFAICVLAEPSQIPAASIDEKGSQPLALSVLRERPDASTDEISENVIAGERGDIRSVIDVASDNGGIALRVVVIKDRIQKSRRLAIRSEIEIVRAFFASPAQVGSALRRRHSVHFLERALSDVADP